jgi:hypothetical protein
LNSSNAKMETAAPDAVGAERPPGFRTSTRKRLRCRSVAARDKRAQSRIRLPDDEVLSGKLVGYEGRNYQAGSSVHSMQANVAAADSSESAGVFPSSPPSPCEAGPTFFNSFTLMHCNIRGWLSHSDELYGHIRHQNFPSIVALNETLLDNSVQDPALPGYELVGRHESAATRRGIAVYALKELAPDVVLVSKSEDTERMWFVVHTQIGAWHWPFSIADLTAEK